MSTGRDPALAKEIVLLLSLSRPHLTDAQVDECRALLREHGGAFDWGHFIDQAGRHRVLPLVGRNIARHRLHYSAEATSLIPYRWLYTGVYLTNKTRNEHLAEEFGRIFLALSDARFPYAVRKGPVLVENLYGDPGLRRMADLDLLVAPADAKHLAEILRQHGYAQGRLSADGREVVPFRRATRAFWRLNINNELPFVKVSDRLEVEVFSVDICLSVFQHKRDRGVTQELLDRRRQARLCGQDTYALSPDDQFIDLCLHFHKEATSLHYIEAGADLQVLKFLDIALSAARLTPSSWRKVRQRAGAYNATESVYYALHHARTLYPEFVPVELVADVQPRDVGFLNEYGTVDGQTCTWDEPLLRRLFHGDRKKTSATSIVPRV
ncbi:nucleotidyltransferase family protein [Nonomuraea sp. NPDC050153]|uniref:nucleotidyltransferase family protein n=1 Tax=Nonomuraea sp. NPDC050153 TaxID=3364359 RepID=UPI0037AD28F4